MARKKFQFRFRLSTKAKLYLAVFWLLLTTSLIYWWLYFALGLLSRVDGQAHGHRQMLLWEGMTLVALLLIGGSTLIYFIFQEQKQNRTLAQFFAAFSHDLKTSLASLRLQAESLKEDVQAPEASVTISRLLTDTSRLQVQVENSLYLGQSVAARLFMERLQSEDLLATLVDSWPQLRFQCPTPFEMEADRRAIETVLNNLAHNSLIHGQATEVEVKAKADHQQPNQIEITIRDNGTGFKGDKAKLGVMHSRHNPSSGSGLGLFIVSEILKQMGGQSAFIVDGPGFGVQIKLKGRMK